MDAYCDAWNSARTDVYGLASPLLGGKLLKEQKHTCNNSFAVLCIEVKHPSHIRHRRSVDHDSDELLSEEEYTNYLKEIDREIEK